MHLDRLRHALIQDTAYASLLRSRRQAADETGPYAIGTPAARGAVRCEVPSRRGCPNVAWCDLAETVESLTGGGGRHILFPYPGGLIKNSAAALGSGLDGRGDGGYIMVPPSLHASGQRRACGKGQEVRPPVGVLSQEPSAT
jgi:hypothetical protein